VSGCVPVGLAELFHQIINGISANFYQFAERHGFFDRINVPLLEIFEDTFSIASSSDYCKHLKTDLTAF
jgi:hypothetical protein